MEADIKRAFDILAFTVMVLTVLGLGGIASTMGIFNFARAGQLAVSRPHLDWAADARRAREHHNGARLWHLHGTTLCAHLCVWLGVWIAACRPHRRADRAALSAVRRYRHPLTGAGVRVGHAGGVGTFEGPVLGVWVVSAMAAGLPWVVRSNDEELVAQTAMTGGGL